MILERYSNNSAALVPELSKMITKLPSDRRTTLQYACDLLSCLAVHSANTKMTTASLAMCIGPDLLRPSIDSLESALRIPQANEALAEIVAHYDEIFSERMLVRDANLLPTVSSSQSPATSIDSSYNTSDANASAVAGNAPQSSLAIRPVTPPAAVAASPGLVPLPTLAPLPPLDLTGSPSPTHSSEASDSPTTPSRGAKPPVPAKPKVPPKPGAAASPAAAPSSPARAEAQSSPKHTGWASSSVSADSPHLKRAGVRLQTRDT